MKNYKIVFFTVLTICLSAFQKTHGQNPRWLNTDSLSYQFGLRTVTYECIRKGDTIHDSCQTTIHTIIVRLKPAQSQYFEIVPHKVILKLLKNPQTAYMTNLILYQKYARNAVYLIRLSENQWLGASQKADRRAWRCFLRKSNGEMWPIFMDL